MHPYQHYYQEMYTQQQPQPQMFVTDQLISQTPPYIQTSFCTFTPG